MNPSRHFIDHIANALKAGMVLFIAATCLLSLTSCCCLFGGSCAPPDVPARPPGPKHFILTGTADLQGMLEANVTPVKPGDVEKPAGGIARIAALFKLMKSAVPGRVITVSTGDDLMGPYFHTFNGKAIFTLMTRAGYDIFAPGNHEFDRGPAVYADALKYAGFTPLCSDLAVAGTPLRGHCRPYLLKDYGGVTFGFFSLMTEDLPTVTSAAPVRLQADNITMAKRMVSLLREKGANVIIALTHVGTKRDREIATRVEGIDIIFGGHSHHYLRKLLVVGKTVIVNGGEKGTHLVKLDFYVSPKKRFLPEKTLYSLIPVNRGLEPDPEVAALLAKFRKSLPPAIVLGTTDKPWDLSKKAVRLSESGVADLVNDLLRKKFKVDVVLNNSGAFRGKKVYPPGKITDTMLQEIDEFRNNAYILELKGKYIRQILEHSAASYGRGGFMQVSGLRYTFDTTRPKQVVARDASGRLTIAAPGQRVTRIEIQDASGSWKPLNPEKSYKILTNSFLVDKEGDGYFWFKRYGRNLKNTYSTFYSILSEYVQKRHEVSPPEPDGRIKILSRL